MENTNLLNLPERKTYLEPGQIIFIVGVFLVLTLFLIIKNPQLLQFKFSSTDSNVGNAKYVAYVPPDATPQVAGASTIPNGPSVIGDDGTIAAVADTATLFGVTSDDTESLAKQVQVNTIKATPDSLQLYLDVVRANEASFLEGNDLSTAFTTKDPVQIKGQANQVRGLLQALSDMVVPEQTVRYHQLLTVQYQASLELVENFFQLEKKPDLVNQQLGIFLQTQDLQQSELLNLKQKYNLQ